MLYHEDYLITIMEWMEGSIAVFQSTAFLQILLSKLAQVELPLVAILGLQNYLVALPSFVLPAIHS